MYFCVLTINSGLIVYAGPSLTDAAYAFGPGTVHGQGRNQWIANEKARAVRDYILEGTI